LLPECSTFSCSMDLPSSVCIPNSKTPSVTCITITGWLPLRSKRAARSTGLQEVLSAHGESDFLLSVQDWPVVRKLPFNKRVVNTGILEMESQLILTIVHIDDGSHPWEGTSEARSGFSRGRSLPSPQLLRTALRPLAKASRLESVATKCRLPLEISRSTPLENWPAAHRFLHRTRWSGQACSVRSLSTIESFAVTFGRCRKLIANEFV
jgi:hypothetical protein